MRQTVTSIGLVLLVACSMQRAPGAAPAAAEAFGLKAEDLSNVHVGMGQAEVQRLCGPPHAVYSAITWKAFLVILPLNDAWRLAYHYRGAGIVAFSCGVLNSDCNVIAIAVDANEPG